MATRLESLPRFTPRRSTRRHPSLQYRPYVINGDHLHRIRSLIPSPVINHAAFVGVKVGLTVVSAILLVFTTNTSITAQESAPRIVAAREVTQDVAPFDVKNASDLTNIDGPSARMAEMLFGRTFAKPVRLSEFEENSGAIIRRGPADLHGYAWTFGRQNDVNQDGWPDGWVRPTKKRGYPNYIEIGIVPHDPALDQHWRSIDGWLLSQPSYVPAWQWVRKNVPLMSFMPPMLTDIPTMINRAATRPVMKQLPPTLPDYFVDRYLRITLDGGLAELTSSAVPTARAYQYRFRCRVMTKGLKHNTAVAELVFVDDDGTEIETRAIDSVGGTTPWKSVSVDRIRPPLGASHMKVRLRVQPGTDGLQDIFGEIGFDDVEIEPFPQLRLLTDQSRGIYWRDQPIDVVARLMGLQSDEYSVRFRMIDQDGKETAESVVPVARSMMTREFIDGAPDFAKQIQADENSTREILPGDPARLDDVIVRWKPPRLPPGFYRFSAVLEDETSSSLATESTIAVIDELISGPPHGPFGWSLPHHRPADLLEKNWSASEIVTWLRSLGVSWVKYPSWLEPDDEIGAENLTVLFRKLQDSGIQVVGMLDSPPESRKSQYTVRGSEPTSISDLLNDQLLWRPELETVMSRLTLRCRTWQLGSDGDHSFLTRSQLSESITEIATGLQGFGQPIEVALSWPWLEPTIAIDAATWKTECRSSDPVLNAKELDGALAYTETDRNMGPRTWILLNPIPRTAYTREDRIRDLVLRMATVRKHDVEAAWISHPADLESGLLRPDGRPDDLLLPWRTASRLIGDLKQVGSLVLRSGASNIVLAGPDRAVMIVWASEPTDEFMYLGERAAQVDVWGRKTPVPRDTAYGHPVHRVKIGPVPTFLVDVDPTLLAFRMSVDVQPTQLDSLLGEVQPLTVSFTNPTSISLIGSIDVKKPRSWRMESPSRPWEMLASRLHEEAFEVVLANNATVGDYEIPITFEFQTTPPRKITTHRTMSVGPENMSLKTSTRMIGDELIVQVEVSNFDSRPVAYRCNLFPQNGRQDKRLHLTVPPGKTVKRYFSLSDGEQLIGKNMWLKLTEYDTTRVLNYPIMGER